jgi:hypothetical protein
MSYEEATAILCDIERNVDVACLRHDGLDIWPLLRLMLWRQLTGGGDAGPAAPAARAEGWLGKLRLAARALLRSGRGLSKAGAVFFVAGGERSAVMAGKALSPIGDSLKDYAGTAGISSVTLDASQAAAPYGEPFSVRPEIALAFLRARLARLTGAAAAFPGLEELDAYLKRAYPQLRLDRAQLLEELRLIAGVKRSFLPVLKAIAPKAVFLACYYHPIAMGLILACRARRIRTIEVQHGQQGDYHGMYANWSKAGAGGYALMPDIFWCWGQQSADRINRWSRPSWPAQQAIVGGNPWMARQIHQPDSAAEEALLSKVFAGGKTHVLVALQPVEDALPAPIREAIALSPPRIRWLIRFHPKMGADRKAEIRGTLTATGKDNFEMDLASSLPLARLLKRADFVITLWSSVAYEALLFGAHPIIAHENGQKSFKSYIDRGLFSYVGSSQGILDLLARGRTQRIVENNPYIETREEVIFDKLRWSVS